ncbi:MAG: transcriptional repressor [Solirubrobacterales bacterium]|nr:transcriptional repressor [Solirubrobacterales bacterium]
MSELTAQTLDGAGATAQLRASGLRVTPQRLAVLGAVRMGGHPGVEEIGARALGTLGTVSTQTLYDVLGALDGAGLVRRIEPAGSPARYEARVGDNHHHVVCRSCGTIGDVDCTLGAAPCLEPSAAHGFAIDEAEVTFWGTCPSCQRRTPSHPPTTTEE